MILDKIKKHKYFIAIMLISIIVSAGYSFVTELCANDVLWNFSFIYKMYNGAKIYNDLNVIITPIFPYFGLILFEIFGANYITFGIYNILIYTFMECLIYILLNTINNNSKKSFIEAIFFLIYISSIVDCGANYNTLALCFVILGIIIDIKYEKSKYIWLMQGIVSFVVFFTKQNIGFYYVCALIGSNIYRGIIEKNLKKYIKNTIKEGIVFIFMCAFAFAIMYIDGVFNEFINYTILTIGEFSENFSSTKLTIISEISKIIGIVIVELVLIEFIDINEMTKRRLIITTIYSAFMMGYMYPIFNSYHLTVGNAIIFTNIMMLIEIILKKCYINNKLIKISKILILSIISTALMIIIFYGVNNIRRAYIYNCKDDSIYKGVYISDETREKLSNICEYIIEKKKENVDVIIVSYKAPLYITILNINNKEFDLPLKGNLGREGEEGLVKKISNLVNTEILITKDEEDKNYQESEKVREYIINNLEYVGEIEEFYIYKTAIN